MAVVTFGEPRDCPADDHATVCLQRPAHYRGVCGQVVATCICLFLNRVQPVTAKFETRWMAAARPPPVADDVIIIGTYHVPPEHCAAYVCRALWMGFRRIDTATCYRNEAECIEGVRRWWKEQKSLTGNRRPLLAASVFISTKISPTETRGGYASTLQAVRTSTERLGFTLNEQDDSALRWGGDSDCGLNVVLDAVLLHWPGTSGMRPDKPANVTLRMDAWRALEVAKQRRWFRRIGLSNFQARHIATLADNAETRIPADVHQLELHPLCRQEAAVDASRRWNPDIEIQAYSPLGGGAPELVRARFGATAVRWAVRPDAPAGSVGADTVGANSMGASRPDTVTPAQMLLMWSVQRGWHPVVTCQASAHMVEAAMVATCQRSRFPASTETAEDDAVGSKRVRQVFSVDTAGPSPVSASTLPSDVSLLQQSSMVVERAFAAAHASHGDHHFMWSSEVVV